MVTGILIPTDPAAPLELREFPAGSIRQTVGGIVEGIDLPALGARLCTNRDSGVFNARATFLWAFHRRREQLDAIVVGPAVLVGIADPDGADDAPNVPVPVRQLLLNSTAYRTVVRVRRDPKWHGNQLRFPDYWGAIGWAMLLQGNWSRLKEIHVVAASDDDK